MYSVGESLFRMYSVGESLFGSRNSVRSETDNAPGRERASRKESGEINKKQMRGRNGFNRRKPPTKPQFGRKRVKQKANERGQWRRLHSVGESLLRSRNSVGRDLNRKQMRGSNEAECIQSEKACLEAAIPSEAKPSMHQEEKEQAEKRVER
jgi:hypothetical protein